MPVPGPGGVGTVSDDLTIQGDLIIKDPEGHVRIRLDSQTGNIFINDAQGHLTFLWEAAGNNLRFGGHNQDGDLVLFSRNANDINNTSEATVHLNADQATILLGGAQTEGRVVCKDASGNQTVFLDGGTGTARVGANGRDGQLFIQNGDNDPVIHLDGGGGTDGSFAIVRVGGDGTGSSLTLFPKSATNTGDANQASIALSSETGSLTLGGQLPQGGQLRVNPGNSSAGFLFQSSDGALRAGGGPNGGGLLLFPNGEGASSTPNEATINLNAQTGAARIGGGSGDSPADGSILLHNHFNVNTISLAGDNANIRAGANGTDGDILLYPSGANDLSDNAQASIHIDAQEAVIRLGGSLNIGGEVRVRNGSNETTVQIDGQTSAVILRNSSNQETIRLDGQAGDIILQNADCAEDFELATDAVPPPGSVLVIDSAGKLRLSDRCYDTRVAGIVAGAGEFKPGIILGRKRSGRSTSSAPIALTGRVCCIVDASEAPIQVGDLLTTSSSAGCAMKASDPSRAFGAVVGKALASLENGVGIIPVLVGLQ